MGDRVCASIIIGGPLAAEHLDDFLDLIEAEGVGPDWDLVFDDRSEIEAYVRSGEAGVAFFHNQALSGEFDSLSGFCTSHGLDYKLTYDGYPGGWGAATRILGVDGLEISCSLNEDGGSPCLSLEDIQLLGLTNLAQVQAFLRRVADYRSPPLVIRPA